MSRFIPSHFFNFAEIVSPVKSNLVQLRDVARREKSIREAELKKKEDIYHGYIRNYTVIESISFR